MVDAQIKEEPLRRRLEDGHGEQRPRRQVDRTAHIRPHPLLRRDTGIRRIAHIEDGKRPVIGDVNTLTQPLTLPREAQMRRFDLADGLPQRTFEEPQIQGARDLQVLTDVVHRIARIKLLSMPDTKLASRQLPTAVFISRHAWAPQSFC